ncbi:MAG: winged helix-turn-helix transcriptional regulator [Candidatus Micrarchaeaceae archaeon]
MREYDYSKRAVLRMLCEDARASITDIAKYARCSRSIASRYIKELEDEFGLRYTIDFKKDAIGLAYRYILWIKFATPPPEEKLLEVLKEDYKVQFAATTAGDFDLLVEVESSEGSSYILWETALAYKLAEYRPSIHPSQIVMTHIGFIPISNDLLSTIDLSNQGISERDKKIILALNENSRSSYREIAKKTGINEDTVRYRMSKIMSSGIIQRLSAIVTKPPTEYNMAFFVTYRFAPGTEKRAAHARKYYMEIDGKMPLINTFQILAPTSGSERFFVISCFDSKEEAMEKGIKMHKVIFKGDEPKIVHAKIGSVLKGFLPIRNIDVRKLYNVIKWEPDYQGFPTA